MGHICEILHGLKPLMLMVALQIASTGLNILYKLAANDGMNLKVLVAYRLIFATASIVPLALIFERKSRPKLSWMVLFQAFLCGMFGGSVAQNLYAESLTLTSTTFATAMSNLVPAVTLILAIPFRLEKLGLRALIGKAKLFGTSLGVGGALLLTFYRGAEINIWSTNIDLLHRSQDHCSHSTASHLMGALMALASQISYALWLIIQTKMSKTYPCNCSSTALMSTMGAIQCVVFALCSEKNWSQWKLGWNIRLLTVAYAGIVISGLAVTLIAWCAQTRGPFFVSSFNPLSLVLVAIVSSLVLGEKLHLGSILGSVLVVCGLYMVLWAKSKEEAEALPTKSSTESELVQVITNCQSTLDAARDGHSMVGIEASPPREIGN